MRENYIGRIVKERYKIVRELVTGDEDYSFVCDDILAGKKVAMRLMPYSYKDADSLRDVETLFQNQMDVLCRLEHPGLPQILEGFTEKNEMYIITEYFEGETLEEKLAKKKELTEEEILLLAQEVLKILDYLHSRYPPVIFRDLKPTNIYMRPNGRIQLINFSLARTYKPFKTQDTVVRCSKGYAAPEQYGGKGQTDARVDVYSFGVTLHRVLTGHDPCQTPFKLPPLETFHRSLWPWWQDIISRATELKLENRYKSAREILNDIKKLSTEPHVSENSREETVAQEVKVPREELKKAEGTLRKEKMYSENEKRLIILKLAGFFVLFVFILLFIIGIFRFTFFALIAIALMAVVFAVAGYFFFFRKL
jgi:eukaryotic-like serine/threonine-protein kinase